MPLLSKALINANMRKIIAELAGLSRPTGMSKVEWRGVQGSLERGNRSLLDIMHRADDSSDWEWGGLAKPEGETIPQTSMSPVMVHLSPHTPFNRQGLNVVYHSHPSWLSNTATNEHVAPGSLSALDLSTTWRNKNQLRGVTAVDPDGGFGYAFMNPQAPPAPNNLSWQQLKDQAKRAAEPFSTQRDIYEIQPVTGSHSGVSLPSIQEDSLAMERGLGEAMRRTGILEHYGRMPGSPAAASGEAKIAPAVSAAADAAEEYLSNWLRSQGYSDGKVRAIIGSLIASGSLVAAASHLANRESVDA